MVNEWAAQANEKAAKGQDKPYEKLGHGESFLSTGLGESRELKFPDLSHLTFQVFNITSFFLFNNYSDEEVKADVHLTASALETCSL